MRHTSQKYPDLLPKRCLALICLLLITSCNIPGINKGPETANQHNKRSYYKNGNLEYEAEYLNGKLDGMSRYWSIEGALISESEYSNGKPHGIWKKFEKYGVIW